MTADLRKLLDDATKGPWTDSGGGLAGPEGRQVTVWHLGVAHGQRSPQTAANAALIVAAVNALPDLLAVCEAAKTWQSTWEAVNGPHGINDVRRYSEAKNALTAALAQWEKRNG